MTPNVKSISEKKNKFAKWPQHRICQEDIHIDIDMDDH